MTTPSTVTTSTPAPTVIGLDLGTKCGWCILRPDGSMLSGTWNLSPASQARFEGGGMRFLRFERYLGELLDGLDSPRVAFEEVRRHAGTSAAHVYGGLLAILTATCERRVIPYASIPVGQIKRHATNKGNASKEDMIASALRRWPDFEPASDDEADARWIAVCGLDLLT